MKKKLGWLVFLLTINCYAQESGIADYFHNLKELDYQNALALIDRKEIGEESFLLKELAKILIHQGGYLTDKISIRKEDTQTEKIIKNLIMGYQNTFGQVPSSLDAYMSFSKALKMSEEINLAYLQKASLIAILDLFKKEIFIGSKQYKPYLERFEALRSDETDEVLYIFYKIIFFSKGSEDLTRDELYDSSFYKLDSIFQLLPETSKLLPYYTYEQAIFAKLHLNFDEAIRKLKLTQKQLKDYEQFYSLNCVINWQISDTWLRLGNAERARFFLSLSEECASTVKDDFYDSRLCAKIEALDENYEFATFFWKKSVDLEYKLGYKNNTLESSILSVQNQTDKLKLDKLELDSKRLLNRNLSIGLGFLLVFGLIISYLVQKNNTKKRKLAEQEALLEQQKVEALLREQELVSIDAMIAGQEKERQKVADELHDDLGSLMATVKLHFDNVKVDEKDPAMKNAQALLEKAYQKIRKMAHAKNSGVMADQGLLPAVKKMARTISETNALDVTVEDFGLDERLENSMELTIFRILQELVANIIKHALATRASIQFTQHDAILNIIVEDNGQGFDIAAAKRGGKGMGLGSIEKRIEHLEGNFTVDSVLGKGTSILIDIPV